MPNQNRRTARQLGAIAEVLAAFALVHVGWRSFKHFTTLGRLEASSHQNLSPGLIMIGFSLLSVWSDEK